MYTRKFISFFYPPATQDTEPLPNAGTAVDAEFDWPPSAEDVAAFSVVRLHADDASDSRTSSCGSADVA